jgi:hypothetical protein
MTNPFATTTPAAPAAPTAAPAAPAAAPAAPTAAPTTETPKKKGVRKDGSARKNPAPPTSMDQKKYIIENYAKMSRGELASALGLTPQQVYNVVKIVRDAGKARAAAMREAGDTAGAAAVEAKIEATFPRKMTGGKGGGGRKKSEDVASLLDDLLG